MTTAVLPSTVALFALFNAGLKPTLKDYKDNRNGCPFIVIDAYNEERVLKYNERQLKKK